jgi:NADH-ubiquinone oxidoreductase chain 4L
MFVFNRKNIILMLISIEIMLLAITYLVLVSSLNMDDILGQTISIYIIVIAGAESAIGLAILVAFYRLKYYLLSYYLSYGQNNFVKNVNLTLKGMRKYSTIVNKGGAEQGLTSKDCVTKSSRSCSIDPWFITGLFDAESSFVIIL